MERFFVITNREKDENLETAHLVQQTLEEMGKSCEILEQSFETSGGYTNSKGVPKDAECGIIIGGDGTLIQAAIDLVDANLPIFGINLGTLGFLTEVEQGGIREALERVVQGSYRIEKRMMLYGHVWKKGVSAYSNYGLNDIVLTRWGNCSMVRVKITVNGEVIDTYVGDGVIVCTPTGSTGYNLSSGGPVMAPETRVLTITPICPHSLTKRSLVVSADDVIELEVGCWKDQEQEQVQVNFDGKTRDVLGFGDRVVIRKARQETRLIKLTDLSFFDILRNKLSQ